LIIKQLLKLKSINLKFAFKLFKQFVLHPTFIIGTIKATLKTFKIAEKMYPKSHSSIGEGNAFKHALWNILLIHFISKDEKISILWAENITTLYEDCFINDKKSRKMDFENNELGRRLYQKEKSIDELVFIVLQNKKLFHTLE